jgi:hypothetical protein
MNCNQHVRTTKDHALDLLTEGAFRSNTWARLHVRCITALIEDSILHFTELEKNNARTDSTGVSED